MKVEVQTQILSTETLSKVNILSILELIELLITSEKMSIFSSAHFGRTLESTLSVTCYDDGPYSSGLSV